MIKGKRMKKIKEDKDGYEYYFFYPSLFCQYFKNENKAQLPEHRKKMTHKLHMALYFVRGGYQILYLAKNGEIVGYLVFTKCKNWIIRGTDDKDIYTIFIYTYPTQRGKGLAERMLRCLFDGETLEFNKSYKTIGRGNVASIKSAEKFGYKYVYSVKLTRFLKTRVRTEKSNILLYEYSKNSRMINEFCDKQIIREE